MKALKPMVLATLLAANTAFAAATTAAPASPDQVTTGFLHALNSSTGPAINTLPAAKARQVLIDAQNSVKVDLSGIDVSSKTIEQDGISVPLTIVRPQGVSGTPPVFMFFPRRRLDPGRFPDTSAWCAISSCNPAPWPYS